MGDTMDTVPSLTQTIDIHEAQQRLPELVSLVIAGAEVILTKGSTPLARLVPLMAAPAARVPGLHPGVISTTSDFDTPLSDEFWLGIL